VTGASSLVIGLDIGASKIRAGLVNCTGQLQQTAQCPTAPSAPAILADARALCAQLQAQASAPVRAIGIGSAGIVDCRQRQILHANANIPDWAGTRLATLHASLPISAENDVRAFAYGEASCGAGRGYRSLLCLTVGTGIGGAILQDGELWHGAAYSAGEIGYLVVGWEGERALVLDCFCSGPAIERAYQAAAQLPQPLPLPQVGQLAARDDALALQAIQRKAWQLGRILAGYVPGINPDAVIIGGGVPELGALWWQPFAAAFYAGLPPLLASTPLLRSALGIDAVLLGAALLAYRKLEI